MASTTIADNEDEPLPQPQEPLPLPTPAEDELTVQSIAATLADPPVVAPAAKEKRMRPTTVEEMQADKERKYKEAEELVRKTYEDALASVKMKYGAEYVDKIRKNDLENMPPPSEDKMQKYYERTDASPTGTPIKPLKPVELMKSPIINKKEELAKQEDPLAYAKQIEETNQKILDQLDEAKIPFEDIYDKYFDLSDLDLSDVSDIDSPNASNLNNQAEAI